MKEILYEDVSLLIKCQMCHKNHTKIHDFCFGNFEYNYIGGIDFKDSEEIDFSKFQTIETSNILIDLDKRDNNKICIDLFGNRKIGIVYLDNSYKVQILIIDKNQKIQYLKKLVNQSLKNSKSKIMLKSEKDTLILYLYNGRENTLMLMNSNLDLIKSNII